MHSYDYLLILAFFALVLLPALGWDVSIIESWKVNEPS